MDHARRRNEPRQAAREALRWQFGAMLLRQCGRFERASGTHDSKQRGSDRCHRDIARDLARANRADALAYLTESISQEIRQPLAATAICASAASRWLAANPPNLTEAAKALERIVCNAFAADEVVNRVRASVVRHRPWHDFRGRAQHLTALMRAFRRSTCAWQNALFNSPAREPRRLACKRRNEFQRLNLFFECAPPCHGMAVPRCSSPQAMPRSRSGRAVEWRKS